METDGFQLDRKTRGPDRTSGAIRVPDEGASGLRLEVRRGGPFLEQHLGFRHADTLRRQFPRRRRTPYLIDQCFGRKSDAFTVLLGMSVIHLADLCPPDR